MYWCSYPEWPHVGNAVAEYYKEHGIDPVHYTLHCSAQLHVQVALRGYCHKKGGGVGVTTSQLNLLSLTPLSLAGFG